MTKKKPQAALGYAFLVIPEDKAYFIQVPDLPGCMTVANSQDEIIPMVTDAVRSWIMACEKLGRDVPPPAEGGEHVFDWPSGPPLPATRNEAGGKNGRASADGKVPTGKKAERLSQTL